MLREIKVVSQTPGEPFRRWFQDDYFDLYLWFEKGGVLSGFQLCYDRQFHERAFTWLSHKGRSHSRVDSSGTGAAVNWTPILRGGREPLDPTVVERFEKEAHDLDRTWVKAITDELRAWPHQGAEAGRSLSSRVRSKGWEIRGEAEQD